MLLGCPKIPLIMPRLISKQLLLMMFYSRYPFVAADILISCVKIADSLIQVKEEEHEEVEVEEE